jgi:hypothetical protein
LKGERGREEMASITLGLSEFGLFADEVYSSTDLNRRAGEVLDHARKRPVTISRNKELFALLKREHAARLIKTSLQFEPTLDLVAGVLNVVEGKEPPASLVWLKAFDTDELREMIREILVASVAALHDAGDWDSVNAIMHEWRESALVASSGVLEEAMTSSADESPLPDPRSLPERV